MITIAAPPRRTWLPCTPNPAIRAVLEHRVTKSKPQRPGLVGPVGAWWLNASRTPGLRNRGQISCPVTEPLPTTSMRDRSNTFRSPSAGSCTPHHSLIGSKIGDLLTLGTQVVGRLPTERANTATRPLIDPAVSTMFSSLSARRRGARTSPAPLLPANRAVLDNPQPSSRPEPIHLIMIIAKRSPIRRGRSPHFKRPDFWPIFCTVPSAVTPSAQAHPIGSSLRERFGIELPSSATAARYDTTERWSWLLRTAEGPVSPPHRNPPLAPARRARWAGTVRIEWTCDRPRSAAPQGVSHAAARVGDKVTFCGAKGSRQQSCRDGPVLPAPTWQSGPVSRPRPA